jgi:hypothetical protein
MSIPMNDPVRPTPALQWTIHGCAFDTARTSASMSVTAP